MVGCRECRWCQRVCSLSLSIILTMYSSVAEDGVSTSLLRGQTEAVPQEFREEFIRSTKISVDRQSRGTISTHSMGIMIWKPNIGLDYPGAGGTTK